LYQGVPHTPLGGGLIPQRSHYTPWLQGKGGRDGKGKEGEREGEKREGTP